MLLLWCWLEALAYVVFERDRSAAEAPVFAEREESGAVIVDFPVDLARVRVLARIQAGDWPDDFEPDPTPTAGRRRHLRAVS